MTLPPCRLCAVVVALAALLAAGCSGDDGIRSYSVARSTEREARPEPAGDYRLLGAMFPADDPVWFFKFSGPAEHEMKSEADFDTIMASVKLSGSTQPEFARPDGWRSWPCWVGVV